MPGIRLCTEMAASTEMASPASPGPLGSVRWKEQGGDMVPDGV